MECHGPEVPISPINFTKRRRERETKFFNVARCPYLSPLSVRARAAPLQPHAPRMNRTRMPPRADRRVRSVPGGGPEAGTLDAALFAKDAQVKPGAQLCPSAPSRGARDRKMGATGSIFQPQHTVQLRGFAQRDAMGGTRAEKFLRDLEACREYVDGVNVQRGFEARDRVFCSFDKAVSSQILEDGVYPRVAHCNGHFSTQLGRDNWRQRKPGSTRLLSPTWNVLLQAVGENVFLSLALWDLFPWSETSTAGRDCCEGWTTADKLILEEYQVRIFALYYGPKGPTALVTFGLEVRTPQTLPACFSSKRRFSLLNNAGAALDARVPSR